MTIQFGKLLSKTFESEDKKYHVFKLRCHGGHYTTAIYRGIDAPTALKTVEYELHGGWTTHPKYGKQFRIDQYRRAVKPDHPDERPPLLGSLKKVGRFDTDRE